MRRGKYLVHIILQQNLVKICGGRLVIVYAAMQRFSPVKARVVGCLDYNCQAFRCELLTFVRVSLWNDQRSLYRLQIILCYNITWTPRLACAWDLTLWMWLLVCKKWLDCWWVLINHVGFKSILQATEPHWFSLWLISFQLSKTGYYIKNEPVIIGW